MALSGLYQTRIILINALILLIIDCEDPFSFSPFEVNVKNGYKNTTEKNLIPLAESDTVNDHSLEETGIKWYQRPFVPVQFAANIGFISAGVGFASRNKTFQSAFLYGYVSKSVSAVTVHTITSRYVLQLSHFRMTKSSELIPYAALSISLEVGGRSFFFLPPEMPNGYYNFPKSIHLFPALGVKNRVIKHLTSWCKGYELFDEVVTADAYLWYRSLSSDVKFAGIIPAHLGLTYCYNKQALI